MTIGKKHSQKLGLFLVLLLLVGFYALSKYIGLTDLDIESIRTQVEKAGFWGFILYIAIFAGGEFIHIPGMVFVVAGILAYGKMWGFSLAFIASVFSVCFSFLLVRAIGGTPLNQIERPFIKKILSGLAKHPIRVILVLRLFLWLWPALNYTLALTNVRFRDYLIKHPELAEEYATLKAELALRFPTDREAYLDGKAPFIERVLGMARSALRDHG